MGRRKSGRNVNGVILLNKPLHMSSNAALQKVRRFFNANKAGHTGALDPLATGLLPLCFGEATKLSHFSLEADKGYRVTAHLGIRTTTSDAEGEVVAEHEVDIDEAQIRALLPQFMGKQLQSPSMYSALKHEGRPLYAYAREGIEVPRKTREIEIKEITLLGYQAPYLELDVRCSKGTYIRTLIDDFGQALGCGAHVSALHRTWIEGVEGEMVSIEQLQQLAPERFDDERDLAIDYSAIEQQLLPHDCIIQQFPVVDIDAAGAARFQAGNPADYLSHQQDPDQHHEGLQEGALVRAKRDQDQAFLGVGFIRDGKVWPKRVCLDVPPI